MNGRGPAAAALAVALVLAAALASLANGAFRLADGEDGGTAGVAASLLEVERDPALADAVDLFRSSHGANVGEEARRRAESELRRLAQGRGEPARRSAAANLLGILAWEDASLDPAGAQGHVEASVESFQSAVRRDPGNEDAKYNLELLLTLLALLNETKNAPDEGGAGANPAAGAGGASPGRGY